jgi:hypothetical protein
VLSDQPNVSGPRYRLIRRLRDLFFSRRRGLRRRLGICQELGEFLLGEAQEIEPPIGRLKFPELRRQRVFVPPGVLTDPVVSDLCCAQHKSPYVAFAVMWRWRSKLLQRRHERYGENT